MSGEPSERGQTSMSLTLTAAGVTLLGVLVSIGFTVGFGLKADLWLRVAAGAGSTLALLAVVKLATSAGRGPLARLANWAIGARELVEQEQRRQEEQGDGR